MLLSVPWQRTKSELAQAVDIVKDGYWSKHRRTAASNPKRNNEPRALEVTWLQEKIKSPIQNEFHVYLLNLLLYVLSSFHAHCLTRADLEQFSMIMDKTWLATAVF